MGFLKLLLIAGLSVGTASAQGKSQQQKLRVYLDWFPNVEFAGMYAAKEKGWYKDAGIDLELIFKGLDIVPNVLGGHADIGMNSGHDLVRHIGEGAPIRAFAAQYQLNPNCILVGKNSKINSVADLKGKKLGIFAPQEYDMFKVMLASKGLSFKDVTFVDVKTFKEKEIIEVLRSGKVDAIIAWEFNWTITFPLLGYEVRVFPGYENGFHFYGIVFFAPAPYIDKNQKLLEKFLRITFEGWREVYKNSDYYAELVVDRYFPKERYINQSRELTLKQQKAELKLRQRYFSEGVGMDGIGRMTKFKWDRSVEIAKEFGILPAANPIKGSDIYDFRVIDALFGSKAP